MFRTLGALTLAMLLSGCGLRAIDEMDDVYYSWGQQRLLCGVSIDDRLDNSLESIRDGIERAARNDEVLVLYAHDPGSEVSLDRLEAVLAATTDMGVEFLTFQDFSSDPAERRAGVALTFDDGPVGDWFDTRELFAAYGARVTFFVTRVSQLNDTQVDQLHQLADDGHAIESHGHQHLEATDYLTEHGLDAWVEDELLPGLRSLQDIGFDATSFAYPFGYRTARLDEAALRFFAYVRSISWSFGKPIVQSPCGE